MRVAVHPCFPGFDLIGQAGDLDLAFTTSDDPVAFADLAAEADALVINGPNYTKALADSIARPSSRLRFMQFISAGYENAEFFGTPPGILISNGSLIWAPMVAEHAVALLMAVLRQVPQLERLRAKAQWDRRALLPHLRSLDGLRVGILGYGTIGREIAKRLKPFGTEAIGIARNAKPCEQAARVVPLSELPELLPTLGALVVAVPAGPTTLKMVDAPMLGQMRNDAVLVNIGRGATIDEAALYTHLAEGRLAGAGLDVAETEPMPPEHPFWSLDNIVISPHVAGFGSDGAMRRAHQLCRDNLQNFRDGNPLISQVFLT